MAANTSMQAPLCKHFRVGTSNAGTAVQAPCRFLCACACVQAPPRRHRHAGASVQGILCKHSNRILQCSVQASPRRHPRVGVSAQEPPRGHSMQIFQLKGIHAGTSVQAPLWGHRRATADHTAGDRDVTEIGNRCVRKKRPS